MQRIFKHGSNIQNASFTPVENGMYRLLPYVIVYGSYKLLKLVHFWPTLYFINFALFTVSVMLLCVVKYLF